MKKNTLLSSLLNEFKVSKMEPLALDGTDNEEIEELDDPESLDLGDLSDDVVDGDDQYGLGPDGQPDGLDDIDGYLASLEDDGEGEDSIYAPEGEGEFAPEANLMGDEDGEDGLLGDEGMEQEVDPDFEGSIRTVHGACLVYKRKGEDGLFEELWIYEVGEGNESLRIRKSILAGTDVDPNNVESEDGTQSANTYSVGNVQFLNVHGLPN